jgi:hypothetical protein
MRLRSPDSLDHLNSSDDWGCGDDSESTDDSEVEEHRDRFIVSYLSLLLTGSLMYL